MNVDWRRDVTLVDGPTDQLDHSSIRESYGGKIGIEFSLDLSVFPNGFAIVQAVIYHQKVAIHAIGKQGQEGKKIYE